MRSFILFSMFSSLTACIPDKICSDGTDPATHCGNDVVADDTEASASVQPTDTTIVHSNYPVTWWSTGSGIEFATEGDRDAWDVQSLGGNMVGYGLGGAEDWANPNFPLVTFNDQAMVGNQKPLGVMGDGRCSLYRIAHRKDVSSAVSDYTNWGQIYPGDAFAWQNADASYSWAFLVCHDYEGGDEPFTVEEADAGSVSNTY